MEVRFASQELPEVLLGRLLSSPITKGLEPVRLPQADIPYSAREADPNLRYQPCYQLAFENELIRLGTGAISYHVLAPYPGWDRFFSRAEELLRGTLRSCGQIELERCGLRYINALTADGHGVSSVDDLNLAVMLGNEELADVSISFLAPDNANTETVVRVASARHVEGDFPASATFAVDLDVRTKGEISAWNIDQVLQWLQVARDVKNRHFFKLLPADVINRLEVN